MCPSALRQDKKYINYFWQILSNLFLKNPHEGDPNTSLGNQNCNNRFIVVICYPYTEFSVGVREYLKIKENWGSKRESKGDSRKPLQVNFLKSKIFNADHYIKDIWGQWEDVSRDKIWFLWKPEKASFLFFHPTNWHFTLLGEPRNAEENVFFDHGPNTKPI